MNVLVVKLAILYLPWENKGDLCLTLAKCAACPPSCISVANAVKPEPTDLGDAKDVKFV